MCVRSAIDDEDPKNEQEIPYEDWILTLGANETVQIDLDAVDASSRQPTPQEAAQSPGQTAEPAGRQPRTFDTYLELRRGDTIIFSNDDRPDSLNSRIVFTAPEAGDFVVRARPLFSGRGEYVLSVTALAARPAPIGLSLGANEVPPPAAGQGSLQERSYTFEAQAGERVRLELQNRLWGDQLALIGPDGQGLAIAGELDEELAFVRQLTSGGTYRVEVRLMVGRGPPGPRTLLFERLAGTAARQPRRIRAGESLRGEIGIRSATARSQFGDEILYELFELRVLRGQPLTIDLSSTDFDPVLEAGTSSVLGFASAVVNDDDGASTDSRLVLRPEESGRVILRVRSLGNRIGGFQLRVTPGEPEAPRTQRVFIHFAGTMTRESVLALNNQLRAAGWRMQGESGQRIASAAGYNEVRYSAEGDRAAAEALATALTEAGLGSAQVTTRQLSIIVPGVLEVWISN